MSRSSKHEKKYDDEAKGYIPLTNEQIRELHLEVIQAGGHQKFLEKIGVMKFDQKYGPSVIYDDFIVNTKVRPNWDVTYKTEILYDTWKDIMEQLEKYEYGLEMQKRKNDPDYNQRIVNRCRQMITGKSIIQ